MTYKIVVKSEVERWLYINTDPNDPSVVPDVMVKLDPGATEEHWTRVFEGFVSPPEVPAE